MKKFIAPLIITLLFIAYIIFYFGFFIYLVDVLALRIVLGIIPLALIGVMVAMCVERYKEIRSGEEDDLSKY